MAPIDLRASSSSISPNVVEWSITLIGSFLFVLLAVVACSCCGEKKDKSMKAADPVLSGDNAVEEPPPPFEMSAKEKSSSKSSTKRKKKEKEKSKSSTKDGSEKKRRRKKSTRSKSKDWWSDVDQMESKKTKPFMPMSESLMIRPDADAPPPHANSWSVDSKTDSCTASPTYLSDRLSSNTTASSSGSGKSSLKVVHVHQLKVRPRSSACADGSKRRATKKN